MSNTPLIIPEVGKKYKINWIQSRTDLISLSKVKVINLYNNKINGTIVEYRDHGLKTQVTLAEWNNRLVVEL